MIQRRSDLPQALSARRYDGVRVRHGLVHEARDGTTLCLDLLCPPDDGAFPVVLIRTPYDKVSIRELRPGAKDGIPYDHEFVHGLVARGYVVAIEDVRGRFNSDGEWHPYVHEQADGYDTVEWIADQPWCDGNVGMVGRSYVGYTQWTAAAQRPRALKAIVPIGAQPDLFASGFPVFNGVFNLPMGEMLLAMGRRSFQVRDFMANVLQGSHPYFDTLPIADIPRAAGAQVPGWWTEMMSHPTRDAYWLRGSYREALEGVAVAAMNVSGWYDLPPPGALDNAPRVPARGAPELRGEQRLVMGPWAHWADISAGHGPIDFGPAAAGGLGPYIVRFFDRWLKGMDNGLDDDERVHLFAMGANEWWAAPEWPVPGASYEPLYLRADGRLSRDTPAGERPDVFRYDPADPVTGAFSMHNGPVDDRPLEGRHDVLRYVTEPLTQPLDVAGPLRFVLHAATSATDTDWHVRLVDIHPDGYTQFLSHGLVRARFRESLEYPSLVTPDEPVRYDIDLGGTANRFLPGHRIGVTITSSWFPRYERNLNTGAENTFLDAEPVVADQTVFHDGERPSYLLLPRVSPF
jgi:putative CocE/NonD family hydrolase